MAPLFGKLLSVIITLLGFFVMAGWLFDQDALKSLNMDFTVMVFNTALCFSIAGAAMLWPEHYVFSKKSVLVGAGSVIIFLCIAILMQDTTGYDFGMDQYFVHIHVTDDNPNPGRMAPLTAICFALSGVVLLLLSNKRQRAANILCQAIILIILLLSMMGMAAASIRLDLLYEWYQYGRMSLPTALNFLMLTAVLWISWFHQEAHSQGYLNTEDKRIRVTGIVILGVVSLAAGLSGFAIIAHQMEKILEASLRDTFSNHAKTVQETIDTAIADSVPVTTRILLNRGLEALAANANDINAQKDIQEDAASFLGPTFSAVAIYSLSDRLVAQAGDFTKGPLIQVALANVDTNRHVDLLWKDGAVLQIRMNINADGKKIGSVLAERKLPSLENLLLNHDLLGASAETRICFAQNDNDMGCFPSIQHLEIIGSTARVKSDGPTSMDLALRGQGGLRLARDYLKHQVLTVYGPISHFGLGMVVKIDAAEFYGPLREQLQYVLVILLIMVGAGVFLQHVQLVPLVTRLVRSEKYTKAIMANVLDLIITFDEHGIIETVNSAIVHMFGYKEEEVLGQSVELLMAGVLKEPVEFVHNTFELSAHHRDGHEFTVLMTVSEMFLGKHRYFVGSVRDITMQKKQQKELELSEETFRSAMENASSGMAIISPQGKWIRVNDAFCSMLGYERQELLALGFRDVSHQDDVQNDVENIEKILAGEIETYKTEKRYLHKNGKSVWALLTISHVRNIDGSPKYNIAHMYDITARKEMERMKEEFISTVSHELRTPLTSIRGSLGLIEGAMSSELPPTVNNLITIAHKNSERLILLINDILDIDKIDADKMRFDLKRENASSILKQAIDENEAYAQKFGVRIELDPTMHDVEIEVERNRLIQAISNLLSNAAKFSEKGAVVRVYMTRMGRRIRMCVQDNGPGISVEFQSRIFNKFSQEDASSSRARGGTGLGLYITQKIVEKMGGRIGFESVQGKGTLFWLEFFDVKPGERSQGAFSVNDDFGRVLICEDDPDIIVVLQNQIERAGFRCDIATTIAEAREKLTRLAYTAMTLDLSFRSGNGIDFIRELRDQPQTRDLPLVVVSAKAEEGRQTLNGDAIGIVDWLMKPIDASRLISALRNAAALRQDITPTILHVEDDEDLSKVLSTLLGANANLINVRTIQEARAELLKNEFTLIILDIGLPDGNGLVLLKDLANYSRAFVPVLILSAEEVSRSVQEMVAGAMVKSRMSETKIAETILSLINSGGSPNGERTKQNPMH